MNYFLNVKVASIFATFFVFKYFIQVFVIHLIHILTLIIQFMKRFSVIFLFSMFICLFLLSSFELKVMNSKEQRKCFELLSDTYSHRIDIKFSDDGSVSGTLDVYIHDKESSYENSSYSEFSGSVKDNEVKVELEIEMEGELIYESEVWIYEDDYIIRNEMKYFEVECD